MQTPQAILETAIYADDIEAATAFYREVFGLEVVTHIEGKLVFFRCGAGMLLVFNPDASASPHQKNPIPPHGARGPGHFCFRVETAAEVQGWREKFEALGIEVELVHTWENGALSVYIRDPAGNSVEVAEAALWQPD
jgi:catechol 2,3-dioxygenase-like lactoylglutathione lyase family enzyme